MATVTNVKERAAQLLGRVRLGQSIPANLDARLNEAYETVYKELEINRQVRWSNASGATIPDEFIGHLAALCAEDCTDSIGVSEARLARILGRAERARMKIPQLTRMDYESLEQVEDF